MNMLMFVKSFSSGQITIPKAIRDQFGLTQKFWLKLYIHEGKIIAEPLQKETDKTTYLKKLTNIKGNWFNPKELAANRKQIEKQLANRGL